MASEQESEVLSAAKRHDVTELRALLRQVSASAQNADGQTPLHEAVLGAGERIAKLTFLKDKNANSGKTVEDETSSIVESAKDTLRLLLEKGAIWNDLDKNNETPGCVALRLGLQDLYEVMVDAGVRAEMLLNRLDEYESLSDGEDVEDEAQPIDEEQTNAVRTNPVPEEGIDPSLTSSRLESLPDQDLQSENYLKSSLRFQPDRVLDDSDNGVMMEWEWQLMQRHADLLCPEKGLRILNIGFGMGIIDTAFQKRDPSSHHIIEAHHTVLERIKSTGWNEKPAVTVHKGRWQDVLPKLLEQGVLFDAIFFDTFAEDYKAFRTFFSDTLFGLLDDKGRWSFFNGLGADRQISYDVYGQVVEMDLFEAGFEVEWETVDVPDMKEEIWKGVKRKYWSLDRYRLPTCKFVS